MSKRRFRFRLDQYHCGIGGSEGLLNPPLQQLSSHLAQVKIMNKRIEITSMPSKNA